MYELSIKSYLNEKQEELNEILNKNESLILVSPTDSGKTTALIEYANQTLNKRIAILCPTQALVSNLSKVNDVCAGYGSDWAHSSRYKRFVVTTYDSIQLFDKDWFDVVIIDEAHYIAQAGNYRAKALRYLLELECQKILVTATPNVIERLEGVKIINVEKQLKFKEVNVYNQSNSEIRIASTIIRNRNIDNLLILRINNKEQLDRIQELHTNLKITKLYSENEVVLLEGQDEETYREAKSGVISKETELLLATSIIDAGISLEVNRDVDCYAISKVGLINPIDVVQLSSRVRSHSGYIMTMNIVGRFGNYEEIEYPFNKAKGLQMLQMMAEEYDTLALLNEIDYINLLGRYGITVQEKLPLTDLVNVSPKKGRSYREIAINFSSSKYYEEVKDRLSKESFLDWLPLIQGRDDLHFKDGSIHSRVFQFLVDAINNNIYFGFFLTDKLYDTKLKALVFCNEHYNRLQSSEFNELIDDFIGCYVNQSIYKLELDKLNQLTKQERDSLKQLTRLLFDSSKDWKSKSKTFNPLPIDDNRALYVSNFSYVGFCIVKYKI